MNCPHCNKPNRESALFCKWCGSSIAAQSTDSFKELVGMDEVKEQLRKIVTTYEQLALRTKNSGISMTFNNNMLIMGNTGTGKTHLLSVIQKLFYKNGIIKKPLMKIVDACDFNIFADDKEWDKNINAIKGGILCIENVQKLVPGEESTQIYDLDKLFSSMDSWKGDPIVILSGLPSDFSKFIQTNPDIKSRFKHTFSMKNFTLGQLVEITNRKLNENYKVAVSDEARDKIKRVFKEKMHNDTTITSGHTADMLAQAIFQEMLQRDPNAVIVIPEDIPGKEYHQKTMEEALAELDKYVGINEIRDAVKKIINNITANQERDANAKREIKDHFLFLGNPGTGKTTIARVFANILSAIDVLPMGQLVEVAREDLVSAYKGDTALKVEACVERAMGGILFIDEAYSLVKDENDDFGKEAVDTLLRLMENHRGEFVVIAAGYTKEMGEFLASNSGLASRFNKTINFRDYTAEELNEIFHRMAKENKLSLDEEAEKHSVYFFQKMYNSKSSGFGNARSVRNVFNNAKENQSNRLMALREQGKYTPDMCHYLTRDDIEGEEAKEKDLDTILKELDAFIGMDSVKAAIRSMANKLQINRRMQELGIANADITSAHIVLTGNPGTGKTTIANKLGEIFKAIGLLPTAKVIEKERKDLLSPYQNETGKLVDKACDEAMGGILFIDEAYALMPTDSGGSKDKTGEEAVASLITRMTKDAGKFVVICAGYKHEMEEFINNANPGFRRRFNYFLNIEDYTPSQLVDIYQSIIRKNNYTIMPEAEGLLVRLVDQMVNSKSDTFGNAGEMVKLFDDTKSRLANRLQAIFANGGVPTKEDFLTIRPEDIPYDPPKKINIQDCMEELNQLIGLESVKKEVEEIANYINLERLKAEKTGNKFVPVADHYLFVGNPGTGKTTVARIMGNIFYSLGVLPTNQVHEVTRKDLVVGYVGQTAIKTAKEFKRSVGGIFFIDEAYSLCGGLNGDFGQEATDTILPMLLDYKGKMVCIAAGYPDKIQQWIETNPGLTSRFTRTIHFEDYKPDELAQIFIMKCKKEKLTLEPEAEDVMRAYFNQRYIYRDKNFGNAREVNNYFDMVKKKQSTRLSKAQKDGALDNESLFNLIASDMIVNS